MNSTYRLFLALFFPLIGLSCNAMNSIGVFKKEQQEICMISFTQENEEAEEKQFFDFLNKCGGESLAVTCLVFEHPTSPQLLAENIGSNNASSLSFKLMRYIHEHRGQNKNLRFLLIAPLEGADLQLLLLKQLFPRFYARAAVTFSSAHGLQLPDSYLGLEFLMKASQDIQKNVFSKNHFFDWLKQVVRYAYENSFHNEMYGAHIYTAAEYLAHLEQECKKLLIYSASSECLPLLKIMIEESVARGRTGKQHLLSFFTRYGTSLDLPLIEYQLNCIEKKKSFTDAFHEINTLFEPCAEAFRSINALKGILQTVKDSPRLICIVNEITARTQHESLEKLGYSRHSYGVLNVPIGEIYGRRAQVIPTEVLQGIFSAVFTGKPLPTNVSRQELQCFNIKTLSESTTPVYQQSKRSCSVCKQEAMGVVQYVLLNDRSSLCSFSCLVKHFLKDHKLAHLFDLSLALTDNEKTVLQRTAALIELYQIVLEEGPADDRCRLYNARHRIISEKLNSLFNKNNGSPEDHQIWNDARELASYFGIDCMRMKVFYAMTESLKSQFQSELITQARSKTWKGFFTQQASPFDPRGQLEQQQLSLANTIAKHLSLESKAVGSTLEAHSLLENLRLVYHDLYCALLQRLNTEKLDIIAILKTTIAAQNPEPDLSELIGSDTSSTSLRKVFAHRKIKREIRAQKEKQKTPPIAAASSSAAASVAANIVLPHLVEDHGDTTPFTPVEHKPFVPFTVIRSYFAGLPYEITLFKVKKHLVIDDGLKKALSHFKQCIDFEESQRIKLLFALYQSQINNSVREDAHHGLLLQNTAQHIDPSIAEKIDLHHLFTRQIDPFIFSYGIAELKEDTCQVSLPCAITLANGTLRIGFLQYTFIGDSWMLIHRSFKEYDQDKGHKHISKPLRRALLGFLKENMSNDQSYKEIIAKLEKLT